MDHETVVAYLDRVGVATPAVSDAAGLRTLHRAHQLTVPFENLSIHLAEPISLDEPDLIDKIVRRRRGGFCYELNGAFALLLEALGAQVSRVGARGIMQIMPSTARALGVDPHDPKQAVDGAARLLRGGLNEFGSISLALAGYNAGDGAVRHYGGIPPYAETKAYVKDVLALMPAGSR